jgi:hypothetical protein
MSDFLDRLGDQLGHAHHQRTPLAASSSPDTQGRGRFGRRAVLIPVAILALAAPAVAIVSRWNPALERDGIDSPVATDSAPVSRAAIDALAPLRREQTADDRRIAAPLIKAIGIGNQVDRVQTEAIRAVSSEWALVPAMEVRSGVDAISTEQLCLTNGETVGCTSVESFTKNGLGVLSASKTRTMLAGLVPDGVDRVRFAPKTGDAAEATIQGNFFSLSVPQTGPSAPIKAPPGYAGPDTIPGPPMPVAGTLQWVDSDGNVVGPADPDLGLG